MIHHLYLYRIQVFWCGVSCSGYLINWKWFIKQKLYVIAACSSDFIHDFTIVNLNINIILSPNAKKPRRLLNQRPQWSVMQRSIGSGGREIWGQRRWRCSAGQLVCLLSAQWWADRWPARDNVNSQRMNNCSARCFFICKLKRGLQLYLHYILSHLYNYNWHFFISVRPSWLQCFIYALIISQ